jgi:hypothetical protein
VRRDWKRERETGKAYRSDGMIEKSVCRYETRSNDKNNCRAFGFSTSLKGACQSETQGCLLSDELDEPLQIAIKHHYFIV